VTIYPIPSSNFIAFKSKAMIQNIRIYNLLGVLLKEKSINDFQDQIDISSFSNGEYLCIIQLKDGVVTKKISVVH
jgi:hypothetical protein